MYIYIDDHPIGKPQYVPHVRFDYADTYIKVHSIMEKEKERENRKRKGA